MTVQFQGFEVDIKLERNIMEWILVYMVQTYFKKFSKNPVIVSLPSTFMRNLWNASLLIYNATDFQMAR